MWLSLTRIGNRTGVTPSGTPWGGWSWLVLLAVLAAACSATPGTIGPSGSEVGPDAGADAAVPDEAAGGGDAGEDALAPEDQAADLAGADVGAEVAPDAAAPPLATLRVVHMAADGPELRVELDGLSEPFDQPLAYGDATPAATVAAGTHVLSLQRANGRGNGPALAETGDMTLPPGASVTALVVSSPDSESGLGLELLTDGTYNTPPGRARLRLVHASPDLPAVRLDLYGDGVRDLPAVAPFTASSAEGTTVRAREEVDADLWSDDPSPVRLTGFVLPPLEEGDSVLLVAAGWLGRSARATDGLALWVVTPDAVVGPVLQNPRVWILHTVPNAPSLDVFQQGHELVDDLSYGEMAGPLQLWPGSYTLDAYPHDWGLSSDHPPQDTDQPVAVGACPGLQAGQRYLAVATGFVGLLADEEPFRLILLRDGFDLESSQPLVRIVHAAPAQDGVQAELIGAGQDPETLDGVLDFGESTDEEGLPLPLGPLVVGFSASTPLPDFLLTIDPGLRAFLVLAAEPIESTAAGMAPHFALFLVGAEPAEWGVSNLSTN